MSHTRPQSALTQRLVMDGCKPAQAQAPTLYDAFHAAAMESLRLGAPGLTDASRNGLAISIARKCARIADLQEKAA